MVFLSFCAQKMICYPRLYFLFFIPVFFYRKRYFYRRGYIKIFKIAHNKRKNANFY